MVRILSYTSGKRQVLATIDVNANGEIIIAGRLPPMVEREVRAARARAASADAFLASLPQVFSGSYIRAEVV